MLKDGTDNFSVETLGQRLREMYEEAGENEKVKNIHMFGVDYGQIIRSLKLSVPDIVREAGLPTSYGTEVSKAIGIGLELQKRSAEENSGNINLLDDEESSYWFVGAVWGEIDMTNTFVQGGYWENGYDDKFHDKVNSIKEGCKIAIKATYTRKSGLPFNARGHTVSCLGIKATGTVTKNHKNGKRVDVIWQVINPMREWYLFTYRQTIWEVKISLGWMYKALVDFAFNNTEQDVIRFLDDPYWSEKYGYFEDDEVEAQGEVNIDPYANNSSREITANDVIALPKRHPRQSTKHQMNVILYGAPGTGKTYSVTEYAMAIIEDRDVRDTPMSSEDRETLVNAYKSMVTAGRIVFTTFHQSYSYEDFIQGLRPVPKSESLRFSVEDGVFKKISDDAINDHDNNYVIIIDEINRANISRVFGELITLLEADKRWGELNELSVTLPSGSVFAIPNNLYVVGTMNSADKSISLIDSALRRRFDFIEIAPDYSLIGSSMLRQVLKKLNNELLSELDSSDLLIGHAFFIGKSEPDLVNIMNRNIIPLLYEYFLDNKKKVISVVNLAIEGLDYHIESEKVGRIKISKGKS